MHFTSPKGRARYPHLLEPDRKFNQKGIYCVELVLDGEDAEKLTAQIEGWYEEAYALMCKREEKKKLKRAALPMAAVEDANGEETGGTAYRFKMKALVETRDGRSWEQRPDLFDSDGKPMKDNIGPGSLIRVAGEVYPWYSATLGVGISLRLKAVQVLELSVGAGGSAEGYGFDKEEGYKAPESFDEQFAATDAGSTEDF